jgi:AcrR family transcriptional regulator
LLDAARASFVARGYEATRMEDVAREAGFSKRTVYLEFPSKGVLLATLCEEAASKLRDKLVPVLGKRVDVKDAIRAIAETYLAFYREERGPYRLLFRVANEDVLRDVSAEQKARLREIEATCVGVLAHAIERAKAEGHVRDDVDAWRYAVAVWAAQNGVLQIHDHGLRADLAGVAVEDLYWLTFDAFLRAAWRD